MLLTPALLLASAASPLPLEPAVTDGFTWYPGTFFAALGEAGERDTHVLVYFWYDGSEQCSNMYGVTMAEESGIPLMNERVCFSANTADANAYKLVERFSPLTAPGASPSAGGAFVFSGTEP